MEMIDELKSAMAHKAAGRLSWLRANLDQWYRDTYGAWDLSRIPPKFLQPFINPDYVVCENIGTLGLRKYPKRKKSYKPGPVARGGVKKKSTYNRGK